MAASLIVNLLAQRPADELARMHEKLVAERKRLSDEISRVAVELQQVEDALARQARKGRVGPSVATHSTDGPSARKRVAAFIQSASGPVTPADASAALRADGWEGSPSGIYNALRRLVESGTVVKVGDGLYQAAAANGSHETDRAGLEETETGEPLFTATRSQEGDQGAP